MYQHVHIMRIFTPNLLFLMRLLTIIGLILMSSFGFSQNIAPENDTHDPDNTIYALTNAKVYISADEVVEWGTLIIQNGRVQSVGLAVVPPRNAVKIDMKGYSIYPSFIEIYSGDGVPVKGSTHKGYSPQLNTLKEGPYYWNESVHPEVDAFEHFRAEEFKSKKEFRSQGFGMISTHYADGIVRGTSVLMAIMDGTTGDAVLKARAASHFTLSKGRSRQTYPSSQMGAIALVRQFYYDAIWYNNVTNADKDNVSLVRGLENLDLPQIFKARDKLEILRIVKIAKEFEFPVIVKGAGDEYKRIQNIKESGAKLILPVNFPEPYNVTDPYLSRFVNLSSLKDWELRPYNPYIAYKNGIPFCLTTSGLKKKSDFLKNVRKAVKHGLPKNEALRSLTQNPAEFLEVSHDIGDLKEGKLANFIVVKGDLFEDGVIYENWTKGKRKVFKEIHKPDLSGDYNLNVGKEAINLVIGGTTSAPTAKVRVFNSTTDTISGLPQADTVETKANISISDLQVSISFVLEDKGLYQLNGVYNEKFGILDGSGTTPNGDWVNWSGIGSGKKKSTKDKKSFDVDTSAVNNIYYPNMAYGFDSLPEAQSIFIKNATIWTNEEQGILKDANVLIQDGKIKSVNSSLLQIPNNAVVIDADGKHVTCGIIDEHSHIAISRGVNEGGQNNSAEVSIGDVVRSDDINIYRQLSGGVTAAQLLHGSANPIGGQSALVKLKWGFTPEEMLIENAPKFIKFALGENVKQSNWGSFATIRYPQTRMGVEQVFYSSFIQAKEYQKTWAEYNALSSKEKEATCAPRRDLELEAVAEILRKERFITCHSYVQSEINMLMHVADSMGFTVNTFTHILEGYKVADKMLEHGAGGSTFADWWAYKFEVNDAIPYNAAILHQMGIVTAINSDDAEMGRRLNHEAAKAVKYGGVSEEDAWKMVTLNPAILLHLDDRMGSIKEGKDADIVIWTDNPLSVQAKVDKTIIDGIILYDFNRSLRLHRRDMIERKRIMQLMLEEGKKDGNTRKPSPKEHHLYHCDSIDEHDNH